MGLELQLTFNECQRIYVFREKEEEREGEGRREREGEREREKGIK